MDAEDPRTEDMKTEGPEAVAVGDDGRLCHQIVPLARPHHRPDQSEEGARVGTPRGRQRLVEGAQEARYNRYRRSPTQELGATKRRGTTMRSGQRPVRTHPSEKQPGVLSPSQPQPLNSPQSVVGPQKLAPPPQEPWSLSSPGRLDRQGVANKSVTRHHQKSAKPDRVQRQQHLGCVGGVPHLPSPSLTVTLLESRRAS